MSNQETAISAYSIQGYNLVTLLKRLEAATSRLEDVTVFQEEIASKSKTIGNDAPVSSEGMFASSASGLSTPAAAPVAEEVPKPIAAFDDFVDSYVATFVEFSKEIDDVVYEQADLFLQAFKAKRDFLYAASKSKKPDMSDPSFADALKPINETIMKIISVKDSNRQSKFFPHLNSMAEGCPVLGWIVVSTPISYIPDYKDAAQFWTNRVLKDFKEEGAKHAEWAKKFLLIFDELKAYVKEYATTGPSWSNQGSDFVEALKQIKGMSSLTKDASAAPPPAAGGAPPPPPPPPPPASIFESEQAQSSSSGAGMNAVFDSLNKGEGITKGLKKVDRSEMTHKNPELRASSVVTADASKKPVPPKKPTSLSNKPAAKPPKKELADTKWFIENFQDDQEIIIDGEMHQSVFIGKCNNCTVQIKGKVNALSMSECTKVGLVVDSLVSGVDIIKCTKFGIQVLASSPMISIDQSDGGAIYLPKTSLNTEIFTSSTTALNINVPDMEQEDGDFKEIAVPEQFKHSFNQKGQITSSIVEHAG